jgi:ribose/xylose/arabinose/galactoside ABC-type transport system permease subunit
MYNINSILLVTLLFILIMLAYELGFRLGRFFQYKTDKEKKDQTSAIQAGVLGLLALLLGFTFNMALQRFDNRSQAVINEANAIGTAQLRTKLLPEPYNKEAADLLKEYIELRISISDIDLTQTETRKKINNATDVIQDKIWDIAIKAADIDPRPVTTGYFISSMNDVIDARGERNAILKRHVPEVILLLLFCVFIISGALTGYSSGLGLQRAYIPTILMTLLIVLVVFIIIDLDRPKRGIIKIKQDMMLELRDN